MTAWDDTQSSAAVLSSRLVSAVGASMSDGPRVRPARRGTGGLSRVRRALSSAHPGWETATDERAVRVGRRSLRSPGRPLGHGRVWCPQFESEQPSRDAGFGPKSNRRHHAFPTGEGERAQSIPRRPEHLETMRDPGLRDVETGTRTGDTTIFRQMLRTLEQALKCLQIGLYQAHV